jgi:transposase-like protein
LEKGYLMKKNRHSSEQIVKMLREAEAKIAEGRTVEEVCREMGVSDATYYKWRKSYGQMKVDQVKRLKDLEKENGQLKKLVADLSLDKAILQEALSGKY